ncbi:sugar ABC transporter substrate-binding protein [Paenibacillus silviterrae]|uniref:sugar ABC transporter substrate-binding protein n=1 Tax=Paenibacillus silviterrae TaxID=3242194 RepID=UPI0025437D63|nr:substrate-binding domain-containing protein [Paenibacillus chinjuensis]
MQASKPSFRQLLMLILTVILLASCSRSISSDTVNNGYENEISVAASNTGPMPERTFGILYPMAHPFYENITEQMEEVAKQINIQLIVKAPAEWNAEQQMRMLETMIKQKVSGIAISPIDPVALAPLINKAVAEGIPVICFEEDVPQSQRLSFIGANPFQEGKLMGEIIERRLKGNGMIMIQGGLKNSLRERVRLDGMLDYLHAHSGIDILEVRYNQGNSERALTNLEKMIDDHPHFDALVSLDMISSSTSILVWKAQGLKRTALTFGLTPEVKEAVYNGQIEAVISGKEQAIGLHIIEQLLQASLGKPIPPVVNLEISELNRNNLFD